MAMKLGSKSSSEGFQRQGQAWFCTTAALPSDVVVEVDGMSFHLHKFPLMAKSAKLARLITGVDDSGSDAGLDGDREVVGLVGVPGGAEAFELAVKFCYGLRLEMSPSNIVPLRCAADYLEMGESLAEGNLAAMADAFLNQVVLRSWRDSVRALASCERVLADAERLGVVKRCVDSIASKACSDPSLFGWPIRDSHPGMTASPGGSVLWNGISTGARPARSGGAAWWYEDVAAALGPSMFERLVLAMESRGIKAEIVAGAVMAYARRHLPGLDRRRRSGGGGSGKHHPAASIGLVAAGPRSEAEQRELLEHIEALLPMRKGVTPTWFLFGLLRLGMILGASAECKASLEARIGLQLHTATVDDLLLPNFSYDVDTLYDIDAVQRIVDHFLSVAEGGAATGVEVVDQGLPPAPPPPPPPASAMVADENEEVTPVMAVARLLDSYLQEVAPDANLKPAKFQALAHSLPEYARVIDDGLYRAIDIYLKSHDWLSEEEREKLCRIMDCQKLSLEACTHAASNDSLPIRIIVQVLFFEQLQLRSAISGCFLDEPPRPNRHIPEAVAGTNSVRPERLANVLMENQVMREDMDKMRTRVLELERECTEMREQIQKLGLKVSTNGSLTAAKVPFSLARKFGCKNKLQAVQPSQQQQQTATVMVESPFGSVSAADDGVLMLDKRKKGVSRNHGHHHHHHHQQQLHQRHQHRQQQQQQQQHRRSQSSLS